MSHTDTNTNCDNDTVANTRSESNLNTNAIRNTDVNIDLYLIKQLALF